jgi:serpin B
MKTYITPLILGTLTLGILASCEKEEPIPREARQIDMQFKSAEIVEADHAFGFELFYQACLLAGEENLMISPLSVSYALGMAYNGAETTTLDAFQEVLHFGVLSREEVNKSYQSLMSQMADLDPRVEFSIANSMWYRLNYNVVQAFIDNCRTYFDAEVAEVDFTDPKTLDRINGWIEDKTNDKIRDMLDFIPSNAVMYLINAIYFHAPWKYEFEKDDTYEGVFKLEDGNIHRTDFMQVEGNFSYTSTNDFTAVELPYGDSAFSMVVLLPHEGSDVDELAGKLDASLWSSVMDQSMVMGVHVHLPKFKYEFKSLLNDHLKNLGLGIAFSFSADFSGITPPGDIYISRVIHQTFIDVMEEGTEAAAATIVEFRELSGGPGSHIPFLVDRPFIYVIKENSSGALLFMGKVGKPEYD